MMDTEALHVALQQSFSPDASSRDPAERTIKNLKHVKGSTTMLLQVAAEKQVQFEVRQAAAIQLKNICRECWVERVSFTGAPLPPLDAGGDDNAGGESSAGGGGDSNDPQSKKSNKPPLLDAEDKASIRTNIIEALLEEHEKSIRDLMAETVHSVAVHDFPDEWPDLLPKLLGQISRSDDPSQALRVHNALLALRKICKRYEYKSREQRGPLNEIVVRSFPLLLPLAQRLSSADSHSLEAALMLKQILKIFWSSTQFYLPGGRTAEDGSGAASPALTDPQVLQPWFDVLTAVLAKPLPEADTGLEPRGQPTAAEERNAWPWWKAKKWSVQIMSRLFSRYGIPSYAEDECKEFARHFSQHVAPQFLGPVCETLNLRPSGQFCTDRVVHLCLTFVDLAVELAPTYKMLKPHMDFLLYKVCFPTVCLTPDDVELFECDPHEFVHRQNSPLADFYDPRMSAITLVTDLVKHRGKDVTQGLLGFLTEILHRYGTAGDNKNHVEKDGALLCLGSLSDLLLSKKKYAKELEGMMVTSVYPDFNSPVGYLRCRACWMVQRFSAVPWSDDGTNLRTLIQLVLQRLSDPALPVQIEASKALRFLIEVEGAETTLLPVLPHVLHEYFRIMTEIGNDEVVAALQVIIDRFGDHIEPHAVALVTQLATAFQNYCGAGEEDDDAALAAAQCLECVATVLKGICERPELYKSMEPQLVPLCLQILGNDGEYIEYLEYALDILTFLTYFPEEISPRLWEAFPLIYVAFDQWAFDYLNLMVPPLENFIGKSPTQFLQGTATTPDGTSVSYIDLVFSMVAKTVAEERSSEPECRKALSLYMSVLHNCRGLVDAYLPMMNDIALAKLGQQVNAEVPLTRIAVFQVIGSALYYNPQLELAELEKRGVTQQLFAQWMKDCEKMEKWLPRKITVLGLTSILLMPTSALPAAVSSSIPQLIASVVNMTEQMKEEAEKAGDDDDGDNAIDDEAEEGGDGDDEDFEGFDENEDVTSEADEAYMDALNKLTGSGSDMARFLVGEDWDQDYDDDDEDYTSPLDEVNQLVFLSDTLKGAFQREPEVYQQVQAAMAPDTVNACQKLFAAADAMRAQAANPNAALAK
eukprot:CAMPEP_0113571984 /NCGR_PEP_ID=MMETSP0015_2-20120614/25852_1 /TAXON_ID=2838 /ORGANISM="Odontella" /LENGTH=1096 /DNA_ID=CAMNT_0000474985 /DNA_START=725 /DNA_END=4015 /DNA_ORIENTATION=+ /assembly_acc=CAM_ASM_000160